MQQIHEMGHNYTKEGKCIYMEDDMSLKTFEHNQKQPKTTDCK